MHSPAAEIAASKSAPCSKKSKPVIQKKRVTFCLQCNKLFIDISTPVF